MLKVLIVDDSATMRAIIKDVISRDPEIDVVGEATNPHEARAAIKALSPDVITLDINMPHMSGLEFLEKLMRLHPMPAVIISGAGTKLAYDAREQGAVGFIRKPTNGDFESAFSSLAATLKAVVKEGLPHSNKTNAEATPPKFHNFKPNHRFLAIGASTGGVDALLTLLADFPKNCPPTVITQHMPAGFTSSFAKRLDRQCAPHVQEAQSGKTLEVGQIYLAPGSETHLEVVGGERPMCRLREGPLHSGHRPSVDVLFNSMSRFGKRAVGIILTGMGQDGAEGLLKMRHNGAATFAQDEASSLVYGMPRAAFECGAVQKQLPLTQLASEILHVCSSSLKASQ